MPLLPSSTVSEVLDASRVLSKRATDTNIGSATKAQSSASSLYLTLGPVFVYSIIFLAVFLVFRRYFPRYYNPRTFISSLRPQERSPPLPHGLINWFNAFFNTPDTHVLNTQSLDGFLFLRLLKISVVTCLVGIAITWPILIPIAATGGGGLSQLNIITFANVPDENDTNTYYKYYAFVFCAYLFFGFVIYLITRESLYYISLRQAYLISPLYANRISSRTVLFNSVPKQYLDTRILRELLGEDVVRHIWIPRNTKKLEELVEERDKISMKLESAEVELIKKANAARNKKSKSSEDEIRLNEERHTGSRASRYVDSKDRPTHRTKFLVGKKVDTIDWCRSELKNRNPEIAKMQHAYRTGKEGKLMNSVFVEFKDLSSAQSAYQSLTHHLPLHMAPRMSGMFPGEIIWYNLRILWWERIIRVFATTGAVLATIIFWSIPVAFCGTLSQISYLINLPGLHWLSFILTLPKSIRGVITGLLPVVLLALLMTILPIYLRLMAKLSGETTLSGVEFKVHSSYFWFQVVQVFLVTTLSSGAAQAAATIFRQPEQAVNLLATSLPSASNFYLSYFILQGLGVVSQILLAITGLVVAFLMSRFLDKTPRKMYKRWISLSSPGMGTLYPIYEVLLVIAICYSCIAPLVLGFAAIGLSLFYLAYKYELLYVYNIEYDTKGAMYPQALQHLFVGLYLAEGCLVGLFAINVGHAKACLGPMVLMILLLVFTVLYHLSLNQALEPLLQYLPKTLETEERRILADEDSDYTDAPETSFELQTMDTEGQLVQRKKAPGNRKEVDINNNKPLPPTKQPNFVKKWMRPDIYSDYYKLRQMVPRDFADTQYDPQVARNAYYHPSITAEPQVLWIPRDSAGLSHEEVLETSKVHPMTDEGATLDSNGKIQWNQDDAASAPIHEEKIFY